MHLAGGGQNRRGPPGTLSQNTEITQLQQIAQIADQFVRQRFWMIPRKQPQGNRLDAADRPPNGRHAVTPDRGGEAERGEGDVVKEVKWPFVMQPGNDPVRRVLPADVIESCGFEPSLECQGETTCIMVNKFRKGLLAMPTGQFRIDCLPVVGAGQNRHVMEPGHLQPPLPAHFQFGTFIRLTGVCGD